MARFDLSTLALHAVHFTFSQKGDSAFINEVRASGVADYSLSYQAAPGGEWVKWLNGSVNKKKKLNQKIPRGSMVRFKVEQKGRPTMERCRSF